MGKMNLLKGKWDGKVGQTVGAKWKDKSTIRTYSIPANPKTQAQTTVRTGFKDVSSFVSLFSDMIKYLTSLDTRAMSVRNAIMKANAEMIASGALTVGDLVVNKGGLPNATVSAATAATATGKVTLTFTAPVATNLTAKAKLVGIAVNPNKSVAGVGTALLTATTLSIDCACATGNAVSVYWYVIDYRGSARVGSISDYIAATVE